MSIQLLAGAMSAVERPFGRHVARLNEMTG
jgi:hypothetical protein